MSSEAQRRVARLHIVLPDGREFNSTTELYDDVESDPMFAEELFVWMRSAAESLRCHVRGEGAGCLSVGKEVDTKRDKTTEELIAERFQGVDRSIASLTERIVRVEQLFMKETVDPQRLKELESTLFQRIEALEKALLRQCEGWAQRFSDIEKKIEKNGLSDCSMKERNKTTIRIDERLKMLESYYEAVRDTIHWTKPECEKLTQQLTVIEGKQAATEMAATKLEKRVDGLDQAFASHTVSQHEFNALREHVYEVRDMHNDRVKRLEAGVFPTADQSLPRRFEQLNKAFIHSGKWSNEVDKRLQTLEAMQNPEPVRFIGEGGIEIVVHDSDWNRVHGLTLHELIDRIASLKPKRVIVDASGPGSFVLQEMRRRGLPAVPLPKRTSVVDESMNAARWVPPKGM